MTTKHMTIGVISGAALAVYATGFFFTFIAPRIL